MKEGDEYNDATGLMRAGCDEELTCCRAESGLGGGVGLCSLAKETGGWLLLLGLLLLVVLLAEATEACGSEHGAQWWACVLG